jgi:hypothetical protein
MPQAASFMIGTSTLDGQPIVRQDSEKSVSDDRPSPSRRHKHTIHRVGCEFFGNLSAQPSERPAYHEAVQ